MQVLKENSKKVILEVAKGEFLCCGFQRTSMRTIAARSEVGLSNIYNYFRSKDDILQALVAPLMAEFDQIKSEHNEEKHLTTEAFFSKDYHEASVKQWLDLYRDHKEELFLIFRCAEGSSLASFKERMVEDITAISLEYFREMKDRYPHLNVGITEIFIKLSIDWWLTALEKLAVDDLTDGEVAQFMEEYVTYSTAGWRSLMQV